MLPLQKNCFKLCFDAETPDLETGAAIQINCSGEDITIAHIFWCEEDQSCFIKTIRDNFQTYIIDFDRLKSFVYLLDEAYYLIGQAHKILL